MGQNNAISVIIATRNRAAQLRTCLRSLAHQTVLPTEVILVDVSDDDATRDLASETVEQLPFALRYMRGTVRHPGVQRNQGVAQARGDIVLFADDDVEIAPDFLAEIVRVFVTDAENKVGGVGGIIVNQVFQPLSRLNQLWMYFLGGVPPEGGYAGRVVGPAINFLPADIPDTVQEVDWLNTTCTAYRRSALDLFQFSPDIQYPFDDLHFSMQVGTRFKLLCSTSARYVHKDLGGKRKRDWVALGENSFLARHAIMVHIMKRRRVVDYLRLFTHDLLYMPLALLIRGGRTDSRRVAQLTYGRLRGGIRVLRSRNA